MGHRWTTAEPDRPAEEAGGGTSRAGVDDPGEEGTPRRRDGDTDDDNGHREEPGDPSERACRSSGGLHKSDGGTGGGDTLDREDAGGDEVNEHVADEREEHPDDDATTEGATPSPRSRSTVARGMAHRPFVSRPSNGPMR